MKRIELHHYGSSRVLQLQTVPVPQPGAGEVLLKVEAAGVNYADILRRQNKYFQPTPLPFIPGHEAVGTIERVGEGVSPTIHDRHPGTDHTTCLRWIR